MKIVYFLLLCISILYSGEYHVQSRDDNLVKFISDAPIEDFEGITSNIDGYIYWEGDQLTNQSDFYFEVDLNTLDTGIGLRNRHMRDNYLETDEYPLTHFKGKIISAEKRSDNEYFVKTEGTFFCHGVENKKTIEGQIIINDDTIHIKSSFEVKLSDYKVKIPSLMFYKINEVMALNLDFYLKQVSGE